MKAERYLYLLLIMTSLAIVASKSKQKYFKSVLKSFAKFKREKSVDANLDRLYEFLEYSRLFPDGQKLSSLKKERKNNNKNLKRAIKDINFSTNYILLRFINFIQNFCSQYDQRWSNVKNLNYEQDIILNSSEMKSKNYAQEYYEQINKYCGKEKIVSARNSFKECKQYAYKNYQNEEYDSLKTKNTNIGCEKSNKKLNHYEEKLVPIYKKNNQERDYSTPEEKYENYKFKRVLAQMKDRRYEEKRYLLERRQNNDECWQLKNKNGLDSSNMQYKNEEKKFGSSTQKHRSYVQEKLGAQSKRYKAYDADIHSEEIQKLKHRTPQK